MTESTAAATAEDERLAALAGLQVLDTLPEPLYDDIVELASQICAAPIGLVSLVDRDRQWFKARVGIDAAETHRDLAFCAHAIQAPDRVMEIEDAGADPRFADNALVTGTPHVRFYAGAPIVTHDGHAMGSVCVLDTVPRTLTPRQRGALQALARQTAALFELRTRNRLVEAQARELEVLARVDALTGLPNRRQFDERIEEAMKRTRRTMRPLAVMFLDLDRFKAVNDAHGHPAGDAVLREFARRLKACVRATDTVARLSGDEFVLLLEGVDGVLELRRLADKVLAAVRPRFAVDGHDLDVTCSVGVTIYRGGAQSTSEVLALADGALYQAKKLGRNRFALA